MHVIFLLRGSSTLRQRHHRPASATLFPVFLVRHEISRPIYLRIMFNFLTGNTARRTEVRFSELLLHTVSCALGGGKAMDTF